MNWRHIAIFIGMVVVLVVLVQFWISTYLEPVRRTEQGRPIAAVEPAQAPAPKAQAQLRVVDYRIESTQTYQFDVVYVIENVGERAATNIRVTLTPWKKVPTPDDPDSNVIARSAPFREVSRVDAVEDIEPGVKVQHRVAFQRPNGENDPLPPFTLYDENVNVEFDSK